MADTATEASNGTPVVVDADSPIESLKQTRAQREAAERKAFLEADIEGDMAGEVEERPAPKKPAAKPKVEDIEEEVEKVEADEDEIDEDLEDLDDDAEEAEDDAEDEEETKDPDLAKRMAQVRKREQRSRERIDEQARQHKAAFERERDAFVAEWKPKIDRADAFDRIPKHDIEGLLKLKGYTEDDYEDVSKILYGLSKAAASDPKNRDAVARLRRDRELREEAAAARREAAEVKEMLAKRDAESQQRAAAERYMGRVAKAVTDSTALVKKRLELKPQSTNLALNKIAIKLMDKNGGQLPDPKKVVAVYEKQLRAQRDLAKQLGDDAPPPAKKPAANANKPGAIKVESKPTPTPAPKTTKSLLPSREDMIERLGKINRGEINPDEDN